MKRKAKTSLIFLSMLLSLALAAGWVGCVSVPKEMTEEQQAAQMEKQKAAEEKAKQKEAEEKAKQKAAEEEAMLKQARKQAKEFAKQGRVLLENKQYLEAVGLFDEALKLDPENSTATKGKETAVKEGSAFFIANGDEQLAKNNYDTAIGYYLQASRLDPNAKVKAEAAKQQKARQVAALVKAGKDAMATARHDDAINLFNQALSLDPGNAEARNGLAAIRKVRQDSDKVAMGLAISDPNAAKGLGKTNMEIGLVDISRGKVSQGLKSLKIATQADPRNWNVWFIYGFNLMKFRTAVSEREPRDMLRESISCFSAALALNPTCSQCYRERGASYFWLASIEETEKNLNEADKDINMAIQLDPSDAMSLQTRIDLRRTMIGILQDRINEDILKMQQLQKK